MPRTKQQPLYMKPQIFAAKYDISSAQMSRIVNDRDYVDAIVRLGEKTIRLDEKKLLELMKKKWR